jgi:hypothetical protein
MRDRWHASRSLEDEAMHAYNHKCTQVLATRVHGQSLVTGHASADDDDPRPGSVGEGGVLCCDQHRR